MKNQEERWWYDKFDKLEGSHFISREDAFLFIREVEDTLMEKVLDEVRDTANKCSGPTEPDCTIYNEIRALEERLPDLLAKLEEK